MLYLTDEQHQTLVGNILGDGFLSKPSKNGNSSFHFIQKLDRADYVRGLTEIYSPFSRDCKEGMSRKPSRINGKINHQVENWDGEYCHFVKLSTISHPVFTREERRWYRMNDGKRVKAIPRDLVLSWRTAAFWVCDDGSNSIEKGVPKCVLTLHTQCFSKDDVEFLISLLRRDLDIDAKISWNRGKPIIVIAGDEQIKFANGIRRFILWDCLKNKCATREKTAHRFRIDDLRDQRDGRLDCEIYRLGWKIVSRTKKGITLECSHGVIFTRTVSHLANCRGDQRFCDCVFVGQSGVSGVVQTSTGTWTAKNNKQYLGVFHTVEDAAEAIQQHNIAMLEGRSFIASKRIDGNLGSVTLTPNRKGWTSRIQINNRNYRLGNFSTQEEAAAALEECKRTVLAGKEFVRQRNVVAKSGVKGVYKDGDGWTARVTIACKTERYLGRFPTVEKASAAIELYYSLEAAS